MHLPASWLAIALLAGLTPAHADGGHIALQATSGAYTITLYTAPEPLVTGPADLSLLIQDARTGEVLDHAQATGMLTSGFYAPQPLQFTRAAATNKLLLAATPALAHAGSFALALTISEPDVPSATFNATLTVSKDHRRRTTLLFALVLPLTLILLFLANQAAKRKAVLVREYTRGNSSAHFGF